jgi:hypothetical protein
MQEPAETEARRVQPATAFNIARSSLAATGGRGARVGCQEGQAIAVGQRCLLRGGTSCNSNTTLEQRRDSLTKSQVPQWVCHKDQPN